MSQLGSGARARFQSFGVCQQKPTTHSKRSHRMRRSICLLAIVLFVSSAAGVWPQEKTPAGSKKLSDGFYAVQRESLKEKDLLPLKDGEVLLVNRHRYLKIDEKEPPRFLVV